MTKQLIPTKPILIGLSGKKQSGKNTCASFLKDMIEFFYPQIKIKEYAFADILKQDICINLLGLNFHHCYGTDEEKDLLTDITWQNKQLTGREVMQIVGTDIFRQLKNDVWIEATIAKIYEDWPNIALITDVRFPDEVTKIQDTNGTVIRLLRQVNTANHLSETALDDFNDFDYVLDNRNMTIQEQCISIVNYIDELELLQ